jgi:hypothetical protein
MQGRAKRSATLLFAFFFGSVRWHMGCAGIEITNSFKLRKCKKEENIRCIKNTWKYNQQIGGRETYILIHPRLWVKATIGKGETFGKTNC